MKRFIPIWLGNAISDIGTNTFLVAIPIIAVSIFHVSDSTLGIIVAILTAAPGLLAASLGVIADQVKPYTALIISNTACIICMLFLVALTISTQINIWIITVIAFIISGIAVFIDSILVSIVPKMINKEKLVTINSLIEGGSTVTISIGEILGSALVSIVKVIIQIGWIFLISAFSYIIALISVITRKKDLKILDCDVDEDSAITKHNLSRTRQYKSTWRDRIIQHFLHLKMNYQIWRQETPITMMTFSAILFNFAISILTTLLVPFALQNVSIPVFWIGWLSIPAVILGVFTTALIPYLEKKFSPRLLLQIVLIISIFAVFAFGFSSNFNTIIGAILLCIGLAVLDFAAIVSLVIDRSYRQAVLPQQHQGGVNGLIKTMTWGVDPLAAIVAGILSSYIFGRQNTIFISCIFLIAALLVLQIGKHKWKDIK